MSANNVTFECANRKGVPLPIELQPVMPTTNRKSTVMFLGRHAQCFGDAVSHMIFSIVLSILSPLGRQNPSYWIVPSFAEPVRRKKYQLNKCGGEWYNPRNWGVGPWSRISPRCPQRILFFTQDKYQRSIQVLLKNQHLRPSRNNEKERDLLT